QVGVRSLEPAHAIAEGVGVLTGHEVGGLKEVGGRPAEPSARTRQLGERLVEFPRESPAAPLDREPGLHVVAARELTGSVLCRTVAAENSKTKLEAAPDEVEGASERRGLGPHRVG